MASAGTSSDVSEEIVVDDGDLYHVLGVLKDATEKQINIAFKKLALKYHPDRNVDDEYAAAKYKAVNEAFQVLNDPVRRRQYDSRGEKPAPAAPVPEAVESSSLSNIGRVFGAVISRLGIPLAPHLSQDIVHTAQTICRQGGIEGGGPPLDPRVSDLPWGWAAEAKADRQTGAYFRLTVDPQHAEAGFLVHCRSLSKGKFKIILFDREGVVLHQEDSYKERDSPYTQATFFFTSFDTYRLGDGTGSTTAADKEKDKTVPPLFHRLESLVPSRKKIAPGQYLLCVYGDNFLGKTSFSIIAVPAKSDSLEVQGLEDADEVLVETKSALDTLREEYFHAKQVYERVLEKMAATEEKLELDVQRRERLYTGFVDASIEAFAPTAADFEGLGANHSGGTSTGSGSGNSSSAGVTGGAGVASSPAVSVSNSSGLGVRSTVSAFDSKPSSSTTTTASTSSSTTSSSASAAAPPSSASAATASPGGAVPGGVMNVDDAAATSAGVLGYAASVTTNAAQTATAAGGWIARRFSLGLQSIVKAPVSSNAAGEDLGIYSDDSVSSAPERVMSPDGFSTVLSSPPNETDHYFDAAGGPLDSLPSSPPMTSPTSASQRGFHAALSGPPMQPLPPPLSSQLPQTQTQAQAQTVGVENPQPVSESASQPESQPQPQTTHIQGEASPHSVSLQQAAEIALRERQFEEVQQQLLQQQHEQQQEQQQEQQEQASAEVESGEQVLMDAADDANDDDQDS